MPVPAPPTHFAGTRRRQGRPLAPPAEAGTTASPQGKLQTLEINRSHNGQLARLRVGNVLIIRLPGNPASGFQWQVGTANTQAVRLTVPPQYSPPAASGYSATPSGTMAPGTYTFVYQAVQPGTGPLRLYYVRPNDRAHPRDAFAIGVQVAPSQ